MTPIEAPIFFQIAAGVMPGLLFAMASGKHGVPRGRWTQSPERMDLGRTGVTLYGIFIVFAEIAAITASFGYFQPWQAAVVGAALVSLTTFGMLAYAGPWISRAFASPTQTVLLACALVALGVWAVFSAAGLWNSAQRLSQVYDASDSTASEAAFERTLAADAKADLAEADLVTEQMALGLMTGRQGHQRLAAIAQRRLDAARSEQQYASSRALAEADAAVDQMSLEDGAR